MSTACGGPAMGILTKVLFEPGASPHTFDSGSERYEFLMDGSPGENFQRHGRLIGGQGITGKMYRLKSRVRKGGYYVYGRIILNPSPGYLSTLLKYLVGDNQGAGVHQPGNCLNSFGVLLDRDGYTHEFKDGIVARWISAAIAAAGPAIVVSYLAAGLVILLTMRMLAEMASAHPEIGSFTEFPRLALGHWAGVIGGSLYWYFWVVVVGIVAIAGAQLINLWLPLPVWQTGLALMLVLPAVNLMSTRSYGECEFWFASIKVAAIIAFIVIAGSAVLGIGPAPALVFGNLTAHGGFAPFGAVSVLAGVTTVIFALCVAEIVTIAAAESHEPARTISRLTIDIVVRIVLFYVLSILLIVGPRRR